MPIVDMPLEKLKVYQGRNPRPRILTNSGTNPLPNCAPSTPRRYLRSTICPPRTRSAMI